MKKPKQNSFTALSVTTAVIAALMIAAFIMASTYQLRVISVKYAMTYIIHLTGLIITAIIYRNHNIHRISYLQSFGVILTVGLAIAVITGTGIYVYTAFIDTDILAIRQELHLDSSCNTREINYIKQMISPLYTSVSTASIIAVLSVVYAALIAIFARRTKEFKA